MVEDELKASVATLTLDVAAGERRIAAIRDMSGHVEVLSGLIEELRSAATSDHLETPAGVDLSLVTTLAETPWSEDALSRLKVWEEVCEWQAWSIFYHWSAERGYMPAPLQKLMPAESSSATPPHTSADDVTDATDGGGTPPASVSLLTDTAVARAVALNKVQLPGMGWEWIGSWMVDLRRPNTDKEGWHYANR